MNLKSLLKQKRKCEERLEELKELIAIMEAKENDQKTEAMLNALRAECFDNVHGTSLYWGPVKSSSLRQSNVHLRELVIGLKKPEGSIERTRAEEVLKRANVRYFDGENNSRTFVNYNVAGACKNFPR